MTRSDDGGGKAATGGRRTISKSALSARQALGKDLRDSFAQGDYKRCLGLLDRTAYSVPALANTAMLSLFRAFLLKRLGRSDEADVELQKECHRPPNLRNPEAHARLLTILE